MINPSEIRTGNYVLHNSELLQIESCANGKVNVYAGYYGEVPHIHGIDCGSIDPIPLTAEWLEKFGFSYSKTFKCYSKDYELLFISEGQQLWLCEQDNGLLSKIGKPFNYVHQLQNLYLDLTGEELTIKDNT